MTAPVYHLPNGNVVPLHTPDPAHVNTYAATQRRVVDGDTYLMRIDFGVDAVNVDPRRVRLAGCNAAPSATPSGQDCTARVVDLFAMPGQLTVRALGEDPHGRLLVAVALPDGRDLTELLIAEQRAARWNGRGEPPLPPWPRTVSP
jgi:endonuclease YncB( thermonuclease family)